MLIFSFTRHALWSDFQCTASSLSELFNLSAPSICRCCNAPGEHTRKKPSYTFSWRGCSHEVGILYYTNTSISNSTMVLQVLITQCAKRTGHSQLIPSACSKVSLDVCWSRFACLRHSSGALQWWNCRALKVEAARPKDKETGSNRDRSTTLQITTQFWEEYILCMSLLALQ